MTQLTGDETYLVNPAYQTKGSSGTSEIYWPTGRPGREQILSSEGEDLSRSSSEENTSPHRCSSRSNDGVILESRRSLHNDSVFSLSDTSQNCHLHIG